MTIDWAALRMPASSLLDAVGCTPLVRLQRVAPAGLELLVKVEWYGPTGSVKDRIYRTMLARAEERGDLRAGMTIIECSTGNAGIACAAAAAIKGYACVIVMPEGMSLERKRMIESYGARLELTPGAGTDIDLALARMREIVEADPGAYFFPGEFANPDNPDAQRACGEEIWEQTGGGIHAVVASEGTGGWISGVTSALKAYDSSIRAYTVEPSECALVSDRRWGVHGVPGIADGIVPGNLDLGLLDGVVQIPTDTALEMARRLAREEGMLCGPSSGINVAASLLVAETHPELTRIVTVLPDTGQRYLSGELFGERPPSQEPERDHELPADVLARLNAHQERLEFLG